MTGVQTCALPICRIGFTAINLIFHRCTGSHHNEYVFGSSQCHIQNPLFFLHKFGDAPKRVAESISLSERIDDFLPPPDRLIRKSEKVKITITLDCESVAFFKASAKKNNVKYQTMINEILSKYAERYRYTI